MAGFGLVELLGVAPEDLFTIRVSALEVLKGSPPTTASDVYAFASVALGKCDLLFPLPLLMLYCRGLHRDSALC